MSFRIGVAGIAVASIFLLAAGAVQAEEEEDGPWNGNVNLGLTNTTGTVDSLAFSAGADAERKWEKDSIAIALRAAFGRAGGETNIDQQSGELQWRRTIHERFFWHSKFRAERDDIQQIDTRLQVNTGPGYRIWEASDDQYLDLEAGAGYRREFFSGGADDRDAADARAGFEHRNVLFDKVDLKHVGEFLLPINETDAWLARTEISFGLPIAAGWGFRTAFELSYLNKPAAGNEELNTKLTTGIQYDF